MHLKLGKIILFMLLFISLSASVKLIAPLEVTKGEDVVFKIVARGLEIKFPQIDFINNQLVEELKSSSEAYMIGTLKVTQTTKTYKFVAKESFVIPPFKIEIDSNILKTKAQKISVKKITKTISPDYDIQMQISKTKFYVGEKVNLKIIFTYKDEKMEDYEFIKPYFDAFNIKEKSNKMLKKTDGNYVEILEFYIMAKRVGSFVLEASKIKLETKNKKFTIYSNSLNLDILSLPEKISVVGKYKIVTKIDKQKVKKNEAVKMQLYLSGSGNINNLEFFTFKIPNTTIYSKNDINNTLHKDFEIISNEDFTIPSLSLRYFDTSKQKIMQIKSPSYQIQVGDTRKIKKSTIDKKIQQKGITIMEKIIYFLMGILVTFIVIIIYKKIISLDFFTKKSDLVKELKKLKKQDDFFKKVIPYLGKSRDLDRMIYKLEKEDKIIFKKLKKDILNLLVNLD